ncbi:glycosyltransferase [Sphingomonas sp. M1-B02]|uniref:glycosyltransferase n=1 Tax=Sphingomonas sp. M1-B02 TaxID=3114300 RepID=UPI00223F9CBA|nr:glycosyltransferase [Sphingomonas sp. S6-11]UZK65040.1 glycosyltransferase [Sphingomonas sp. S6-11]
MNVLLVHQNFPGQFKHLAPQLVARGDRVVALTMNVAPDMPGVEVRNAKPTIGTASKLPWAQDFETKLIRGEAALRAAMALRDEGFYPDVIVGHPAWGDTLFVKEVWPEARFGIYCEFFYSDTNGDADFDPEFPVPGNEVARRVRLKLKTLPQRLHFPLANAGISPTRFQADTYPAIFRDRITVIHDGIDTDRIAPRTDGSIRLGDGRTITRADEVVTFVSRNLEPYRGYHIFMRALPELLRRRPNARVFLVGGDGVSYGAAPAKGSWRDLFLNEVRDKLDMSRVHFVGHLPYDVFLGLLSITRLHIYLTYPFVLSWSLIEAMALGAPILGSDTAPVREVIEHGRNGILTPFFDPAALAAQASEMLEDDDLRLRLSAAARQTAVEGYDLKRVCLPRQLQWIDALAAQTPRPALFDDD